MIYRSQINQFMIDKCVRYRSFPTATDETQIAAPRARLIWQADLDPGTLSLDARPAARSDPDAVDPAALHSWLTMVADSNGREHAVLSDGLHRIRFDLAAGTLSAGSVVLRYRLESSVSARPKLLPLRRLVEFSLHRQFRRSLWRSDPRVARWLTGAGEEDGFLDALANGPVAATDPRTAARGADGRPQ